MLLWLVRQLIGASVPSAPLSNTANSYTHAVAPPIGTTAVALPYYRSSLERPIHVPVSSHSCIYCGCTRYDTAEMRACGSMLAKVLNVQTRRFITLACLECGHTRAFEVDQNIMWNVLDLVVR